MDLINYFAEKLASKDEPIEIAEEKWDKRAANFYKNQITKRDYFPEAVTQLLVEKGILTEATRLLDICSGSGRYALPFSRKCKSVLALDLSTEMLNFLQKEVVNKEINNVETIKSPWPANEKIDNIDIAFAAMCPATRTVEAIKEMSNVAKRHGIIGQFIYSSDSMIELLKKEQIMKKDDGKDPHNNRQSVQAYFNILWEHRYHPEITYLKDEEEYELPISEAFQYYSERYNILDLTRLEGLLNDLAINGKVRIVKKATFALVIWDTRFQEREG